MDKADKEFVAPPWRTKVVQRDHTVLSAIWNHASGFFSH